MTIASCFSSTRTKIAFQISADARKEKARSLRAAKTSSLALDSSRRSLIHSAFKHRYFKSPRISGRFKIAFPYQIVNISLANKTLTETTASSQTQTSIKPFQYAMPNIRSRLHTQNLPATPLWPSYSTIPADGSWRYILDRLKSTDATNSELCATFHHTNNPLRTHSPVGIQQRIIWHPTGMSECIADALGSWRNRASISIWTLPCVEVDAGHDIACTACLTAERWRNAGAVDAREEDIGCWVCADKVVRKLSGGCGDNDLQDEAA